MWTKRIREICLEVGIACLIVLGTVGAALYNAWVQPIDPIVWRWVGLAVNTAFVFGYPLKDFRSLWPRPTFWLLLLGLLAAHLALFIYVLSRVRSWSFIYFVPIVIAELRLLRIVAERYRSAVSERT